MLSFSRALYFLAAVPLSFAAVLPSSDAGLVERDVACTNGPLTRACWKNGYSIATDFDKKFPTTGITVTYNLEITNSTCNLGGSGSKTCLLINGQYPGPTIRASWGDTLSITVKNSMKNNGTSIHWHGVRQYHSSGSDGVNGITECPLAPGDTKTYTFQVTQFGSSWYHSHFSAQYGDGVVGAIVFDGPAAGNYDYDLGPYMFNEVYDGLTAWQVNAIAGVNLQNRGGPPSATNLLINGTNKNNNGQGTTGNVTIQSGKKYRLRLINSSVDTFVRVSLDNHNLSVIASDFIPINPFTTQWLLVAIGQRYDVVIHANQAAGNYWFRADVARDCFSANSGAGRAIWTYAGQNLATPSTSPFAEPSVCTEPTQVSPYWKQAVPSASFTNSLDTNITNAVVTPGGDNIVVWALNESIWVDYTNPTMSYLMSGNTKYPKLYNVVNTNSENSWNYWLIYSDPKVFGLPHPIHLHGHDFFVIGSGPGTFSESTAQLNWNTPPRRDTATLPGGGWLAIAFSSNNPGAWLMHCHIAWHIGEGLGMQFVEAPDQTVFPDSAAYQKTCNNWKAYAAGELYAKDDSGL